jgi:hypothetical protein
VAPQLFLAQVLITRREGETAAEVTALHLLPVEVVVKAGPDLMVHKAETALARARLRLVVLVQPDQLHLSVQIAQEILVVVAVAVTVQVKQTPALPFGDLPEALAVAVEAATTN